MNRWTEPLFIACALLSGCAAMDENVCRTTNWYGLGERDALVYGLQPRIDQYVHTCSKQGIQPQEKEYLAGWFVGDRERAVRMLGGVCCAR